MFAMQYAWIPLRPNLTMYAKLTKSLKTLSIILLWDYSYMWLEALVGYRRNWDWPDAVCMPKVPHWSITTRTNCTSLYQKIHMNKSSDNAELVEVSNFFNRSEFIHCIPYKETFFLEKWIDVTMFHLRSWYH